MTSTDQVVVPGVGRTLDATLARLQRGHGDPTLRCDRGVWWHALTTPQGAAWLQIRQAGHDVGARAGGPGAAWALARVPALVGNDDHPEEFVTDHPVVARLAGAGVPRLAATGQLTHALVQAILEQKVTGAEAFTSIRRLTRRFGVPVEGLPEGMAAPPDAVAWARVPVWEFLRAGVEERRAVTVHRAMAKVPAFERVLERCAGASVTERGEALGAALQSLPGIGPWTAAKVRQQVLGDPDAWSVDDYHVPRLVEQRLGGPADAVLAQFPGHRYRVELLLVRQGLVERHGPRRALPTHLPVRGGWR